MKIKVRKQNKDGTVRLESGGQIKEVLINEDIFYPKGESIAVCFQGLDSSGIVEFSTKEIEQLLKTVKSRVHLVKSFERLR